VQFTLRIAQIKLQLWEQVEQRQQAMDEQKKLITAQIAYFAALTDRLREE
jgi:hypothetical protein